MIIMKTQIKKKSNIMKLNFIRPIGIAHNGYGFMSVLFLPNSKNKKDKNKIALKPMLGVSKILIKKDYEQHSLFENGT